MPFFNHTAIILGAGTSWEQVLEAEKLLCLTLNVGWESRRGHDDEKTLRGCILEDRDDIFLIIQSLDSFHLCYIL